MTGFDWIDSRTIKRGRVLVLDGSLGPFCSKCLDACMRANGILKNLKKRTSLSAGCLSADSPPLGCGRSAIQFENVPESLFALGGLNFYRADCPAQVGGRSAALTQNVPERVFSLVEAMICAADGPPAI